MAKKNERKQQLNEPKCVEWHFFCGDTVAARPPMKKLFGALDSSAQFELESIPIALLITP